MTGRPAAGWDRIDSRPGRFVLAIGRDRKPRIQDTHGCDVSQCKLARSLFDKGEFVRMIDVNRWGYVTMIEVSAQEQEPTPNVQNNQT
jgi:hypothetical protein